MHVCMYECHLFSRGSVSLRWFWWVSVVMACSRLFARRAVVAFMASTGQRATWGLETASSMG